MAAEQRQASGVRRSDTHALFSSSACTIRPIDRGTKPMTRSIHATTASGDAVTLGAGATLASHGRTLAHLEHNAMQALGLVRATLVALQGVGAQLDRASLLLSHPRGVIDFAIRPCL